MTRLPKPLAALAANPRVRKVAGKAIEGSVRLSLALERVLRQFYGWAWRKLRPSVSVHRSKSRVTVVDAPRIGGRVHVVPMDGAGPMSVSRTGNTVFIDSGNGRAPFQLAYEADHDASFAFASLRQALLPTSWFTWGKRAAGFLVLVMVFNAFARVMFASPEPASELAVGAVGPTGVAAALADPTFVPPEPEAQTLPGGTPDATAALQQAQEQVAAMFPGVDLTKDTPETRKALAAMEAQLSGQQSGQQGGGGGSSGLPAVAGADVMPGLKEFGLSGGPGDGGPGCDPGLAYKVEP